MDAVFLFVILIALTIGWLADRSRTQARLRHLEAELDRLLMAERRSAPLKPVAPPAPSVPESRPWQPTAQAQPVEDDVEPDPESDTGVETEAEQPRAAAAPAASLRELYGSAPRAPLPPRPELPLVRWIRAYFTGGNLIVRVGVIVLLFGVAFLLKYAAEHSHVPIEWRLTGVAAGASVLLALGWRWRTVRPGYALALQGGGVAILYLVVFAAFRLFHLLDPGTAFALLILIAVASAVLAVMQDSLAFAMFATGGGFLAPLLAASEHGNHVVLFSYYLLIDGGVVLTAWRKSWQPLNLLAFVGTFGIGAAWGNLRYRPELLASTEPFLLAFFLVFVLIAVLFAVRRAPRFTHYVDGTIVFGTPVVVMGLEAGLLRSIPFALAWCAVGFSAFYLVLAWRLLRVGRAALGLLGEAFLALGVAFATLALPLALEGRWTGASWALEGAAILWVGLRQERRLAVAAGLLLQIAAGFAFAAGDAGWTQEVPLGNVHFIGAALVAGGAFVASLLTGRAPAWLGQSRAAVAGLLLGWGLLWWLFAGVSELDHFVLAPYFPQALVVFLAGSAAALSVASDRLRWEPARVPPLGLIPILWAIAIYTRAESHPSAAGGWWAWPLGLGLAYATLNRRERDARPSILTALHALAFWLVLERVAAELAWQLAHVAQLGPAWSLSAWGLIVALALVALPATVRLLRWPVGAQPRAYLGVGAAGLAVFLWAWVVLAGAGADGNPRPLPYVPLINPLDASEGFAVLALIAWRGRPAASELGLAPAVVAKWVVAMVAAGAFVWLNLVLLRGVHHFAGVAFQLGAFVASTTTQASLSIFWTALALATMLWSARNGVRIAWLAGATLMGIVVAKLFLVDFSQLGTVTRIISFLGVGVLMLVVGYFSPVPPAEPERAE